MSASTNVRLKEQFDQLQNQQQKKLMLRKQLKESKEKKSVTNATEQSTTFGVTDELDLQVHELLQYSTCSRNCYRQPHVLKVMFSWFQE